MYISARAFTLEFANHLLANFGFDTAENGPSKVSFGGMGYGPPLLHQGSTGAIGTAHVAQSFELCPRLPLFLPSTTLPFSLPPLCYKARFN